MRNRTLASCAAAAALLGACSSNPPGTNPPGPQPGVDAGHHHEAGPFDATPPPPDAWPAASGSLPEIPAYTPFDQNVLLVKDKLPTVPVFPALRASNDGRVTISSIVPTVGFHLFRPEVYTTPFSASAAGELMVDPADDVVVPGPQFESHVPATDGSLAFRTLCDSTASNNPQPCASDATMDCYQLAVVGEYRYKGTGVQPFELWSTPITVSVRNPKTASAAIAKVTTGTPVKSPTTFMGAAFNEISTTEDGRLLVADTRDAQTIVYSVNAGSTYSACDARGWTTLSPISRMHGDPGMSPYGVAAYPLRDMEGELVKPGDNFNAIYPWMDRKGRNICFTSLVDPLFYVDKGGNVQSRYPVIGCPDGVSCAAPTAAQVEGSFEDLVHRQGVGCVGLWTHGKAVLLDGRLNNSDFGLGIVPTTQRIIQLYEDHSGRNAAALGQVTVGNNFFGLGAFPGGATNGGFLDSLEHRFNFLQNLNPLSLARADVVWLVASGKTTQEVAFDSYVNPNGFIVSSGLSTVSGAGAYNDGFNRGATNAFTVAPTGNGFTLEPHVQNAATAVSPEVVAASGGSFPADAGRWRIPAYGVAHGVRIEPVNAGGVAGIGRGLWSSGLGSVTYDVPDQPDAGTLASTPWSIGIFLDSRPLPTDPPDAARRIMTFPDGTILELLGQTTLRFGKPGKLQTATLPTAAPKIDWVHIGLLSTVDRLSLYENGFLFLRVPTNGEPLFRIAKGTLTVGSAGGVPGFRGWVDRFEVFADEPNAEVMCNHAMGTLVSVSATMGALYDQATKYPHFAHAEITAALPASLRASLYACFHDYTSEFGATLSNVPSGATSLRTELLFPEGPLVWDQPRPDSSKNAFCLGCHVSDHPPTLQPGALTLNLALTEFQDPRRRPLQPLPSLFGDVPASLLGPSQPPAASASGLNVDQYLYP